ncbi:hypothetical protein D9O36_20270 [Zobellia amurskyensis]|uniref:Peptidase S8/S53 domain-containing protein n=1 Tax=Zobellia amurskyensis TaxID=248905 RepID=A0A7X2ZXG0_9FLAO|nr:S8 family serine peptidase [Zobellia amurskyensis]MUH38190.1 hypothetical protein [Zobellia amurskyensis]
MKMKIIFLLGAAIVFSSCSKLDDFHGSSNENNDKKTPEYSHTQVIVRFEKNLSSQEKNKIRNERGIGGNFIPCSCGDPNIELWDTDPNGGESVEFIVEKLRGRSGAEGDLLFNISIDPIDRFEPKGIPGELNTILLTDKHEADQINIAIIDSGVDFGKPFTNTPYNTPYLMKTSDFLDCNNSPTGWNFTDEGASNDILDLNGHGSMVTKIVTSELDKKSHKYSILPIKAFNQDGEGSYWNVVCAFGYLQEIQKKGAEINIINASFGKAIKKSLFHEKNLLNTMIQELDSAGVLVVTSAGNEGLDTDFGEKRHFPSGFIADNILSVGGYSGDGNNDIEIDALSNFGKISIDVAAPFSDWIITNFDPVIDPVQGTSFSTAYVTGLIARSFIENGRPKPIQLKTDFLNNNYGTIMYSSPLESFINSGAYVKRE